ncbi:type II toxin-antitoxin system RelE/ParE family toxin [Streptomyces sp. PKU-EA00015]|uniref:type II toxin-antitoxin system RelE/ParE family toxin n=1 Tax=Streptomyces sp. PKU-EA00015 TaxID=2748326 RepID=UPI0015A0BB82|nr:type II toxin-antitoxin system RelE/ParE family toxin [Streptomyces sp. PKU-EA00015]NWF28459.1 type II toxin-antitoxin system RelE/ParE family toxin [Streptomyces sp. PKU-EA00015]
MEDPYVVEIEPEVRLWLANLPERDYLIVEHLVGRLACNATTLGEPYSRHLGDRLSELRFDLGHNRDAVRLPYRLAPGRRIILLTVFRKSRQREAAEVERAQRAQAVCQAEHEPAHEEYIRVITEGRSR